MTARFPYDFWSARAWGLNAAGESPAATAHSRFIACDLRHEEAASPHFEPIDADEFSADAVAKSISLYIPEGYEPRYAYPLIVWFHGAGGSDGDLTQVMPQISTRNYIGLAIRGMVQAEAGGQGYTWLPTEATTERLRHELFETVRKLRRAYNLHTERVYLAGFDKGGAVALQLLMNHPEWFAGAAVIGAALPDVSGQREQFSRLDGKRVLITVGSRDEVVPPRVALESARLLHAAGTDVALKICEGRHELTPRMLSHLNHWLMDGVCQMV